MKYIIILLFFTALQTQAQSPTTPFELTFRTAQKETTSQITLSFTGDLLIHEDLYREVIARNKQDFSVIFNKISPLLDKSDFSQVNLEGPTALGIDNKLKDRGDIGFVYDGEVYSGTNMLFNYHPQIIDAIKKVGFDLVTTSNNHSYDRGSVGINKTIEAFNDKQFPFVGTRKKGSLDPLYKIVDVKNFKVAYIACTEMLNGYKDKYSQVLLCYDQVNEIVSLVKKIKSEKLADIVIVVPHWGIEYQHEPAPNQKKYARVFAEAGADAIIGSHPHVLQPVEKIVTSDHREVFVAYSLGNFLAFQKDIDRKSSAIVYLEFSKNNLGAWISGYSYQPTVRDAHDIYPAAKMNDVVNHIEKYLGKFKP